MMFLRTIFFLLFLYRLLLIVEVSREFCLLHEMKWHCWIEMSTWLIVRISKQHFEWQTRKFWFVVILSFELGFFISSCFFFPNFSLLCFYSLFFKSILFQQSLWFIFSYSLFLSFLLSVVLLFSRFISDSFK